MLAARARLTRLAAIGADVLSTTAAYLAALHAASGLARLGAASAPAVRDAAPSTLVLVAALWLAAASGTGLYAPRVLWPLRREAAKVLRALVLSGAGLAAVAWLQPAAGPPPAALALLLVLQGPTVFLARRLARGMVLHLLGPRFVLVAGDHAAVERTAALLQRYRPWGIWVVGVATEGAEAADPGGVPRLGRLDEVPHLVRRHVVDEVLLAPAPRRPDDLGRFDPLVRALEEQGVTVRLLVTFLPHRFAPLSLDRLGTTPVLGLTPAPSETPALLLRRLVEPAAALLLLVALSPLLALIALAIKLTSPGPVLFRQTRCGLNGRPFTFLKFRSMHVGAEALKSALAPFNEMDGPVFKMTRDPRVTPLGRLLRRTSLDELPQLWNIVRGEMSFVGPRPAVPEEVARYEPWQRRRLSMKPGLTGLWQVSGRSDLSFEGWIRLDLEYIDNWSLLEDAKILLRTIPAVIRGRGAR